MYLNPLGPPQTSEYVSKPLSPPHVVIISSHYPPRDTQALIHARSLDVVRSTKDRASIKIIIIATLTTTDNLASSIRDEDADGTDNTDTTSLNQLERFLATGELDDDDADQTESQILEKNNLMSLSLDALLNVDIYKFSYGKALAEITRLGRGLGLEKGYIEQKFSTWVYARREDTPTASNVGDSPDRIWRCVPAHCEDWRRFAEIALRFITISTSEADCERMLSRQRDVQGIRTSNIRTELLETLLRG